MKDVQGWLLPQNEKHIGVYFDTVKKNVYQPMHQETALSHCTKFRTAIDIGAHVGLWARGLTEKFESVACFEPCTEFADLLAKNAPKVSVIHRCALGEKEGSVKMDIDPDNTGATHVARGEAGTTPVLTLDSFELNDVDFVKIDVEGYEYEVVKGGYETFKRNSPIVIIEQKARYIVPEQGSHAAVRFLLDKLDYRVIDKVIDDWVLRKL